MKKILYFIMIYAAGLFFSACSDDFLNTIPTDQTSSGSILQSTENAMAALNGIYAMYHERYGSDRVGASQGRVGIGGMLVQLEALGEDFVMTNESNGWYVSCCRWLDHTNAIDADLKYPWAMHYRYISNANVLINGVQDAEGTQEEKDIIQGEALALRAFSLYQLVQLYAIRYSPGTTNSQLGIPLLLNDDPEIYEGLPRSTVEEVYTQINADLDQAIALLDGKTNDNKNHININAARGLKARVALTQGNYATAITNAQLARTGYPLMTAAAYATGFTIADKTEYIWVKEIQIDQTDLFGNFGGYMSRNASTTNIRTNPKAISQTLYTHLAATDVRAGLWDPTGAHPNIPLLSTFKRYPYTNQKFVAVGYSDSRVTMVLLRSAEMYLIEAEAQARLSQDGPARTALEALIVTRDPVYSAASLSGQALIDEILIQRRLELWGEGFRFYDLKRLNMPLDRNGSNHNGAVIGNVYNVPAGDPRWQWLIPQDEMNDNPNMVQNPL